MIIYVITFSLHTERYDRSVRHRLYLVIGVIDIWNYFDSYWESIRDVKTSDDMANNISLLIDTDPWDLFQLLKVSIRRWNVTFLSIINESRCFYLKYRTFQNLSVHFLYILYSNVFYFCKNTGLNNYMRNITSL